MLMRRSRRFGDSKGLKTNPGTRLPSAEEQKRAYTPANKANLGVCREEIHEFHVQLLKELQGRSVTNIERHHGYRIPF